MVVNELAMDIDSTVSDAKDNMATLRSLGASLESMQNTILNEGMSRDVAQLLEQHSPGAITATTRINAFTQYPSKVMRSTGLEAVGNVRSKSMRGVIVAIVSAAVAALSAFLVYLIKRFTGKDATERKNRANDRQWHSATAADAGASRPEWRDDPEYRAATDAYINTINMLLVKTGSGAYTPFLKDVFTLRPRALFGVLTDHVTEAVKLARETADALANSPLAVNESSGNDLVMNEMQKLYTELNTQFNVLDNIKPNGVPGRGPLSSRLIDMRRLVEEEATQTAITIEPTLTEIYGFRQTIDESVKVLETLSVDKLMREMQTNAKFLQKTLDDIDSKFANMPSRAADVLIEGMLFVQRMLEMQADLIAIVSTLMDNVLVADSAYCQLLRAQIDAMQRVGIRFNGSEPEFAEDRKFYKEARRYLD